MAFTGKQFISDRLTDSAATYYTTPTSKWAKLTAFTLTNTHTSPVTVTLYVVPSGGSASDDNIILDERTLDTKESYVVSEAIGQMLDAGDTLQALASVTEVVAVTASGVEGTV